MHRTSNGRYLDLNALKIQQENNIAVGNSRMNARGDLLGQGGQIIKTRDELMATHYNSQIGGAIQENNSKILNTEESNAALVADIFAEPIQNGYEEIEKSFENPETVNPKTGVSTDGGLADANKRSADLAEKMRAQRSRI